MVKDYGTGALKAMDFDRLLEHVPELRQLHCELDNLSFEHPLDSSNINPGHWAKIVSIIEEEYAHYDGFVVLHGSDTMSYTGSALSFMLGNLGKPVVITGSQLPIGDLRTDAKENLITAIQIAALCENGAPVVREVCLYFEYKLYRANRTTKISAEHFNAFASPNFPALAESGVSLTINTASLLRPDPDKPLAVHKAMDGHVAVLKLFPGLGPELLNSVLDSPGLKALVLETYGAGNAPMDPWFTDALGKAVKYGLFVANVTQCAGGSVAMGRYEASRQLAALGVLDGKDITTEAALAKLMHLLGTCCARESVKQRFETPLCGEMR